jgi:hypothetical protein
MSAYWASITVLDAAPLNRVWYDRHGRVWFLHDQGLVPVDITRLAVVLVEQGLLRITVERCLTPASLRGCAWVRLTRKGGNTVAHAVRLKEAAGLYR